MLSSAKRERVPLGQLDAVGEALEHGPAAAALLDERQVDLGAENAERRLGRVDRRVELNRALDLGRRQVEVEGDLSVRRQAGEGSSSALRPAAQQDAESRRLTFSRVKVMDDDAASTFLAKTDMWMSAGVW